MADSANTPPVVDRAIPALVATRRILQVVSKSESHRGSTFRPPANPVAEMTERRMGRRRAAGTTPAMSERGGANGRLRKSKMRFRPVVPAVQVRQMGARSLPLPFDAYPVIDGNSAPVGLQPCRGLFHLSAPTPSESIRF